MGVHWPRPLSGLVVCALLVTLATVSRSPVLVAQALPRIIFVSVVDQAGNPALGLGPADFIVREDKVAREVLKVEPATDPMQVALLIDNSQAAESNVQFYRQALTAFVTDMTADPAMKNRIAIITVAERPTINTEYTADQQQLVKGAGRIFATSGSGSYLLDGIIETSDGIKKRNEPRPVIVAITGGGPELSNRPYPQVLERLAASGAALHVVVIGPPIGRPIDLATVLDQGPRTSGGRYDNILIGSALTTKMKQVAAELLHQYRVTYAHPNSLIPPEQITVSTPRPGLTARGTPARSDREPARR